MNHSSSHHTREGITEKGPKLEGFSNPPHRCLCRLDQALTGLRACSSNPSACKDYIGVVFESFFNERKMKYDKGYE
ncbi:hypothetical protein, partial [Acetobacter orientalis]|uniref:hypothetical protein n=1 Tax=Acetobacter orientalis TaxID=146474 RepID=UPI0039EAC897